MDIDTMWKTYSEKKDIDVRNDIIMHYVYIVQKVVNSMIKGTNLYSMSEDFNSIGTLGLIDAVDKFDISKNVAFETYASIRIRGTIKDYMRKQDWISRTVREKQKRIEDAKDLLMQKKNEEPTDEEIAKEAGLNRSEVGETLSQLAYSEIISFEEDIGEDLKLHETIRTKDPGPEEQLVEKEARYMLIEAIDSLNEREKRVLSLYYSDELKLKEIGYILDISEGRVCQIMQKTMEKLRTYIEKQIKN